MPAEAATAEMGDAIAALRDLIVRSRHGGSAAERLATMPADLREAALRSLTDEQAAAVLGQWSFWRRPDQCPPPDGWHVWLVMAGRGFGKTRMGAEWVRALATGRRPVRIALIAATLA